MSYFEGFAEDDIGTGEVTLHVRHGGSGPAILLLHGHPRTHARGTAWRAARHASHSRLSRPARLWPLDHTAGCERFAVAGHDRGSYVAFRLAMDHPDVVTSLTVMDGVPIGEALAGCDERFARMWWHWFFLGNPAAQAERVINLDPDAWYRVDAQRARMDDDAWHDFRNAVRNPDVVHAMCEDYRAGLTVDRDCDEAGRSAGHRVRCPVLVLWARRDDLATLYGDPVAVWRSWAVDVRGRSIDCGHRIAEDAPEELAAALQDFLAGA